MRLGLAIAIWLVAATASADAVGIGPCDEGWTWVRHAHGGGCEPVSCEPACDGDCVDVARCFETTPMDQGDVPDDAPRVTYERPLTTLCDTNGACGGTAHCVHQRECRPHHGMCSVGWSRGSPSVLGLLVAAFLGRRARRASSSPRATCRCLRCRTARRAATTISASRSTWRAALRSSARRPPTVR